MQNFQNEIPKGRVNITLDVDTNDGMEKRELPLKLLVLGDFSHSASEISISKLERLNVNKSNFDTVVKALSPTINYGEINLKFEKFNDFHPENISMQVPRMRKLIAMRNLLKDLKANVLNNEALKRKIEELIKDKNKACALRQELRTLIKTDE